MGPYNQPVSDQVSVVVPASTAHVAVVRAVATTLAARLDFTYDRITDLHIALDEVSSRIMAASSPPAGQLEFTFSLLDGAIQVVGRADTRLEGGEFLNPWAQIILESLTESIHVEHRDSFSSITFLVRSGVPE